MRRSVLFRRMLAVLVISVLTAVLLITVIFTFALEQQSVEVVSDRLLPKIHSLDKFARRIQSDQDDFDMSEWMKRPEIRHFLVLIDQDALVYDTDGHMYTEAEGEIDQEFMRPLVQRAMAGEDVTATGKVIDGEDMIIIGTALRSEDGTLLGCVFLCEDWDEYRGIMRRYLSSMPFAILITFALSFVATYLLAGWVTYPLRRMTEAANRIATGDFSARANESGVGEVGELARALNHLSDMLSAKFRELEQERDRILRSVDSLAEGFLSMGVAGNIRYYNNALTGMFPGKPESGDERLNLVPDRTVWDALDRVLMIREHTVLLMNWQNRVYQVTIAHIAQGGAVALFRDITESERLEKTRRDYVANVSHELKSPLTAMRALMEPLRDGMVSSEETRNRYYDIMLREISRLTHMIEELMELSRLQSGQAEIEVYPMPIQELLANMALKYRGIAREKAQRFILSQPEELPQVRANEEIVEEALVILLDNAMKYTPAGGEVQLGARVKGQKVEVFVRDNGVGIAPGDLPYVFDRFYKVDKAHSGNGSGLGLSIAKELLAQMGEEIRVTSSLGEGSEFYFTLQRCDDTASSHSADTAAT